MICNKTDCFYSTNGTECRTCKQFNPSMSIDKYLSESSLLKSAAETCNGGNCLAGQTEFYRLNQSEKNSVSTEKD